VVATRSAVRGHAGAVDLGKVSFVERARFTDYVRARRHSVPAERISAAVGVVGAAPQ
jgi:hypothetical protein